MKGNPFNTAAAVSNSNLHVIVNGRLTLCDSNAKVSPVVEQLHRAFGDFVARPEFPCLAAKAAFHDEAYGFAVYHQLASTDSTDGLCRDLVHFQQRPIADRQYTTFISIFLEPIETSEIEFENLLWQQLRMLHRLDAVFFEWDPEVSYRPNDPHFSFSFAGQAFYVIGMHRNSSRAARRFPWPALVFNPHPPGGNEFDCCIDRVLR